MTKYDHHAYHVAVIDQDGDAHIMLSLLTLAEAKTAADKQRDEMPHDTIRVLMPDGTRTV